MHKVQKWNVNIRIITFPPIQTQIYLELAHVSNKYMEPTNASEAGIFKIGCLQWGKASRNRKTRI